MPLVSNSFQYPSICKNGLIFDPAKSHNNSKSPKVLPHVVDEAPTIYQTPPQPADCWRQEKQLPKFGT